jgi:hypothetical protein
MEKMLLLKFLINIKKSLEISNFFHETIKSFYCFVNQLSVSQNSFINFNYFYFFIILFLGSISIAWTRIPTDSDGSNVLHIQPFNAKDLAARSLSDRLGDLEELKFLYPDALKSVFEKFKVVGAGAYNSPNGQRNAYVQGTEKQI